MIFKDITILDENFEIQKNMYVIIKNEKIVYISNCEPDYNEMPELKCDKEYIGKGKLLMSGFYNSHGHSPMTLMRGYGENLSLQDWLNKKIFPFEEKLNGEDVYWGTLLAMAESFQNGIVSTTDMYYFCEDMIKAIEVAGAKDNISRGIVNFTDKDLWDLEGYKEAKHLFENYNNILNGKVKVDMSIHGEYTSNEKTVYQMAEYVKKIGTGMHLHLSETKLEHEECKNRHKMTPTEYFAKNGLFDVRTTAAHCVWVEEQDIKILKNKGVTVASNPFSNLKLASGICGVSELLKSGINVAIGTDSVASNNSLDFFEEMKVLGTLSKVKYSDATLITPKEALYSATRAGAISQGRIDCGLLKTGFKADLIVLDIERPNYVPEHNLLNNLVYSGSSRDIEMTMVDGKVVYEKKHFKTIDLDKTMYNVEKAKNRILKSM